MFTKWITSIISQQSRHISDHYSTILLHNHLLSFSFVFLVMLLLLLLLLLSFVLPFSSVYFVCFTFSFQFLLLYLSIYTGVWSVQQHFGQSIFCCCCVSSLSSVTDELYWFLTLIHFHHITYQLRLHITTYTVLY